MVDDGGLKPPDPPKDPEAERKKAVEVEQKAWELYVAYTGNTGCWPDRYDAAKAFESARVYIEQRDALR